MFKALAEKNVNLYNDHPGIHLALRVGYFGVIAVGLPKLLKKIAGADTTP